MTLPATGRWLLAYDPDARRVRPRCGPAARPGCRPPHHSHATWADGELHLRVLFTTEPALEAVVRARIERALRHGRLRGPDGALTVWRLRSSQRAALAADDAAHAQRLVHN